MFGEEGYNDEKEMESPDKVYSVTSYRWVVEGLFAF
jgi:hypothetical protein